MVIYHLNRLGFHCINIYISNALVWVSLFYYYYYYNYYKQFVIAAKVYQFW